MVALQGTLSPCNPQYIRGNSSSLEKVNTSEHAPQTARRKEISQKARTELETKTRDPLRRLAAWLSWRLLRCHWDACRVKFNPGFAFAYASRALAAGYDRKTIELAYESVLRDEHAVASDLDLRAWSPFRVMPLALKRLSTIAPDWVRPATPAAKAPSPAPCQADDFDPLAEFVARLESQNALPAYVPYRRTV